MYTALSVTTYLLWLSPWWMSSFGSFWLKNFCKNKHAQSKNKSIIFKRWIRKKNEELFNTKLQLFTSEMLWKCIHALTTSSEQLCSCMHSDLRDVTKLKVSGWVCFHKLISRRTLTPLSTTASLITSSMGDQYLFIASKAQIHMQCVSHINTNYLHNGGYVVSWITQGILKLILTKLVGMVLQGPRKNPVYLHDLKFIELQIN